VNFAGYTEEQLRSAAAAHPDDAHSKVIAALLDERDRLRATIEWVLDVELLCSASVLRDVLDHGFDVRSVK